MIINTSVSTMNTTSVLRHQLCFYILIISNYKKDLVNHTRVTSANTYLGINLAKYD